MEANEGKILDQVSDAHGATRYAGETEISERGSSLTQLPPSAVALWAKTPQTKDAQPHWHPLICHLLDVAAVAWLLWNLVLCQWARHVLAHALGLSEQAAGRWTIFWASTHDIGKGSPPFAAQDPAAKLRLIAAGYVFPPVIAKIPHGTISTSVLMEILRYEWGLPESIATTAAVAVGGHHGLFPSEDYAEGLSSEAVGKGTWQEGRKQLLHALADVLEVPGTDVPQKLEVCTATWIAGLISVADWIGSNQEYFPMFATDAKAIPEVDPSSYFAEWAMPRAREALSKLGWPSPALPIGRNNFADMFPFSPNPTQNAVVEADQAMAGQGLMIVEAPMGEGKTEAALWQADRQRSRLGQTGFYFALPTQATSNQMFHRVRRFLERRYRDGAVNLQLLHGMASLSAEFEELRQSGHKPFEPNDIDVDRNDEKKGEPDPTVLASEWFTHRKRGLLAPFGVGTVDQALLAMLQTRHVFVRHFGLGGKVVIVDEVHAYDVYMSTLLEQLLRWLAALGSSVILLSATLPDARRRRMLAAYAEGAGHPNVSIGSKPYPRVSWVSASGAANVQPIDMPEADAKTVSVEWVPDLLPEDQPGVALAARLRVVLSGGGCAAVVCATVDRAQRLYSALTALLEADGWGRADDGWPQIDLFHARYPFEERDEREKRTLVRFGKAKEQVEFGPGDTRPVRRPWRAVLVATSVIEQSLDLDFDLMVTDMAPTDLILQRLGRVWRHVSIQHGRPWRSDSHAPPRSLSKPTIWISGPVSMDGTVPHFAGEQRIYDRYVLLRSWLALRDRSSIEIPADLSTLVETVYGDESIDRDVESEMRLALAAALVDREVALASDIEEAHVRQISGPFSSEELADVAGEPRDEDAPSLHPALQALTRLTEPTCLAICLYGTPDEAFLDAERRHGVRLRGKPTTKEAELLLRRSVTIMDSRVVRALLDGSQPTGWKESAFLRNYWPLYFDACGMAGVPGTRWTIQLDRKLGLRIVDPNKEV